MSIASEWRRERNGSPETGKPVTQADAIMRRVLDGFEDDDLGVAAKALSEGVARVRVTFRDRVSVKAWDLGLVSRVGKSYDDLSERWVPAGYRGHVIGTVSDGRSVVRLDTVDDEVLVKLGEDCVRLRWWHRVADWFARRG